MESSGEGVCLAGWRRWGFLTASGRSLRFLEAQAVAIIELRVLVLSGSLRSAACLLPKEELEVY